MDVKGWEGWKVKDIEAIGKLLIITFESQGKEVMKGVYAKVQG